MQKQPRPFHMAQKLMAEADPLMGALNNARNIRDDKAAAVPHIYHTQVRLQRGKVIVCNFGPCIADNG